MGGTPETAGTGAGLGSVEAPAAHGPGSRRTFPSFDGLRAVAACTIVVTHAALASGLTITSWVGNYTARFEIGVAVFFLISGFLLYRPFAVAHLSGTDGPALGQFWLRRALRILPAYWLAYFVTMYVLQTGRAHHLPTPNAFLADVLFLQIYWPQFILTGIPQAWSLCTEVTFYLFLPIFAAAIALRRKSPVHQLRRELTSVAALFVFGLVFRAWALATNVDGGIVASWLPAFFDLFALGMLLAIMSAWYAQRGVRPAMLWHRAMPLVSWGLAALAFVLVSNIGLPTQPLGRPTTLQSIGEELLYGIFAFFLLLPAVFGPERQGSIRRFLQWRPVVGIGLVSYGIYLWHQAWVLMYARWAVRILHHAVLWRTSFTLMFFSVLGLSVISATVSYLAVERPAMHLKRHLRSLVELLRWQPVTAPPALTPALAGDASSDLAGADQAPVLVEDGA